MSSAWSLVAQMVSAVPSPSPGPVSLQTADPFWQRFFTSAGFGGLTALAAALIAARIAMLQLRHTRSQQLQERWWATLTWVYDRAVVEKDKRSALPHHVTFAMLTQLSERAENPPEDRLQKSAIKSILSMFETSDQAPAVGADGNSAPSATIHVSDPEAVLLHERLQDRLSNDQERQDREYRRAALTALDRVAGQLDARVVATTTGHTIVSWDGKEVPIRIRYAGDGLATTEIQREIAWLQKEVASSYTAIGGLIILNEVSGPRIANPAADNTAGLEVVRWAQNVDDGKLYDALQRLRPPPNGPGQSTAPATT